MPENADLTRAHLKTPKAAAIAGIVFSRSSDSNILAASAFHSSRSARTWSVACYQPKTVALALNLVPFAGVAFLWFIGVLRDRLGQQEDHFFATVFFGSALLFLAMLFAAAAISRRNYPWWPLLPNRMN